MNDQNMIDYAEDLKKYTVKELRQRLEQLMDLLIKDEKALELLSQARSEKTKVKIDDIKKKTKKDLE